MHGETGKLSKANFPESDRHFYFISFNSKHVVAIWVSPSRNISQNLIIILL